MPALHPEYLPVGGVRGVRLRVVDDSFLTPGDFRVSHPDGPVAKLEMGGKGPARGRTRDEIWRLDPDGPLFYLDEPPSRGLTPPRNGRFQPLSYVAFDDGRCLVWKVTSFWRSRRGFCDEDGRCLLEVSGNSLWVRGGAVDVPYLGPLILVTLVSIPRQRQESGHD